MSPSGTMELIASSRVGKERMLPKECSLRKRRKRWPAEGSQVYSKSLEGSHSSLSRHFNRVSLEVRPLCRAPKPKLFRLCLAFPGVSTTSRLFLPRVKGMDLILYQEVNQSEKGKKNKFDDISIINQIIDCIYILTVG